MSHPRLREFPSKFCDGGSVQKTSVMPLPDGKEFDDMCIRLDTIPECDKRTERRTDLLTKYNAQHE